MVWIPYAVKWIWQRSALFYFLGILLAFQLGGAVHLVIEAAPYRIICWTSLFVAGFLTFVGILQNAPSPWRFKASPERPSKASLYFLTTIHTVALFLLLLVFCIEVAGTFIPALYHLAVAVPATAEATIRSKPSTYRARRACEGQLYVDFTHGSSDVRICNVPDKTWLEIREGEYVRLHGTRSAIGFSAERVERMIKSS